MTDEERMLAGELYVPSRELLELIIKNKMIVDEFNRAPLTDFETRGRLLEEMLDVREGARVHIYSPFYCDYGKHIHIDDRAFINHNCTILDEADVYIGKYVRIAPHVGIYTVGHQEEIEPRKMGYEYAKTITIEDNVWIGGHSCILPGVTIGENSIIGAGSVVRDDIPKNVMAAGNPCRVIRKIREK